MSQPANQTSLADRSGPRRVVVMAASAGGIEALRDVLAGVPADLDAAILVVLHIAPGSGNALADILDRAGPLPAAQAVDGEPLRAGHVYVCVPDHHLLVGNGHVHVRRGPRENGHRPAADPLFRSAARYYDSAVIGVVLSGTLSDGTSGLGSIRQQGGVAIVQEPDDALYDGMPRSALEYVGADHVVPAIEIGALLGRIVAIGPEGRSATVPELLEKEVTLMESDDGVLEGKHPGTPSPWPCPDCSGVLWQIDEGNLVRFRCRVGHAWVADDLLNAQGGAVETALWMALRALEDRAALTRMLADRARAAGRGIGAARFHSDTEEYERNIGVLRALLERREGEPTS